jgi:hypothetical protein
VWSYKHQPNRRSKASQRQVAECDGSNSSTSDDTSTSQLLTLIAGTSHEPTLGANGSISLSLLPWDDFDDGCSQFLDGELCALSPSNSLLAAGFSLDDIDLPFTSGQSPASRASISSQGSSVWNNSSSSATISAPNIPQQPRWSDGQDATLALINSWFDQVCPAWSAFDSTANLNRKLANSLWHHSASVFNSLQSMSACFLSARVPHMRRQALAFLRTATVCVQAEIEAIKSKPQIDALPTGLMFSLLCLGTSVCWLDARLLGLPFLKEAKALLGRLSEQYLATGKDEAENLLFFKNSMVYWEMLLAVVADKDMAVDSRDSIPGSLQPSGGNACETSTDLLPHPWTGISSRTAHLFSKSITLCRAYRRILTKPTGRVLALSTAMEAFQEAQRLEDQLLELDYSSINRTNDTGDQKTPWLHLANAAEAYQLSALLQLYVTFPDLVSMRLQFDSPMPDDLLSWEKVVTPLTLDLIKVLERIPPDSGSRVIQPVLYICASTGLRYGPSNAATSPTGRWLEPGAPKESSMLDCNSSTMLEYVDQIDATGHVQVGNNAMPTGSLDISTSREFIVRRLDILENTLQPRPIQVAKKLVKAIWTAYDHEPPGSTSVHWFDVMEAHDLRSLFG